MTPVVCRVKHDPDNGSYGDCMRACIASLLDLDAEAVPHFADNGVNGETALQAMREFLAMHGYVPFMMYADGVAPLEDVFEFMAAKNPGVHYVLFCNAGGADHVVICKDDKKVHDPSWYPLRIDGPNSGGYWAAMVLAKL